MLLLGVAGNALADTDWYNTSGNRRWDNAANWDLGVPDTADKAGIRHSIPDGPIIDSSTAAVANVVVCGDWGHTDVMDITGGTLTTNGWFILGYGASDDGTFNVSGGTTTVGSHMDVGRAGAGHMNMTGGTVTVPNGAFGIATQTGGSGHVQLDDGTISCGSISILTGGSMDITGGTLIIVGNQTADVIGFVNTGKMTAYGGTGTVVYDYGATNPGKTTVTASPDVIYVTVPDVTGLPQATAESDIVAAGLVVGTVTKEPSETIPAGNYVISQTPTGSTSVVLGSSVDLVVTPDMGDGNVNGDRYVDAADLLLFAAEWLDPDPDPDADFTRDGNVDMADFGILAKNWHHNEYSKTLTGKIMSGYQGWFNHPGDGAGRGWTHWGGGNKFEPGYCTVDWWPDVSEYDADELYPTGFNYAGGSTAYVFSSHNQKTVLRHFSWMEEYGIDGAFLQRFIGGTSPGTTRDHKDQVMLYCQEGANLHKRAWAMMYDLSSSYTTTQIKDKIINDWKHLVDTYGITKDPTDAAYLHHEGKPVVAVWGLGFERVYEGQGTRDAIDFLKNDPVYGGCSIMIGVDNEWRERMVTYPLFGEIVQMADIISPWAVGRYGSTSPGSFDDFVANKTIPDQNWCNANGKDYLPVIFPGFSWYNLKHDDEGYTAVFDSRPRLGGTFLWRQIYKNINDAGVSMIYQAMFDEVDEGTAIFKISNDPPVSELPDYSNPFLPTGNAQHAPYDISDALLPTDHYLWLLGEGVKMLRGETALTPTMPTRGVGLIDGTFVHWKLDETTGAVAADDSANGYDGTLMNMDDIDWVAGNTGNALNFDGLNDYVEITGYQGVLGTRSRTCAAWIKTTGTGAIVSWGDSDISGGWWLFWVEDDGRLRLNCQGGHRRGNTDLRDNNWHHVAAVLADDGSPNNSEVKLYVDGVEETYSSVTGQPINTASHSNVTIGASYIHDGTVVVPFNGLIDDVRIYDLALSGSEIVTLAQ